MIDKRYLICTFVLCLLLFPVTSHSDNLFKTQLRTEKKMNMKLNLSKSDTICIDNRDTIYALSVDVSIIQPQESSFTRIILEDEKGHEYLVADCDHFRYDTDTVHLKQFCQETAMMNGVNPKYIKVFLAKSSIHIESINFTNKRPDRLVSKAEQDNLRKAQAQDIVDRINTYNIKHNKHWAAGLTDMAVTAYDKKKVPLKEGDLYDAYIADFDFYGTGIYELGQNSIPDDEGISEVIDTFDWRNRHCYDWTTPANHQGDSHYCVAFATVGAVESLVKLYYNRHDNMDLSERDICAFSGLDYNEGGTIYQALNYAKSYGIIDEDSYPFIMNTDLHDNISNRPYGNECIRISNFKQDSLILIPSYHQHPNMFVGTELDSSCTFDDIKRDLMFKGPGIGGWKGHAMTLIGFGRVVPYVYYVLPGWEDYMLPLTRLSPNDQAIGHTYWIFKNSYAGENMCHHADYAYVVFHQFEYMRSPYFIDMPITSRHLTEADIVCEDADGDGYYFWGIGPAPSSLPEWAPREEDADESNWGIGPMDENGFVRWDDHSAPSIVIDHDTIITCDKTIFRHYEVTNNATLTITGNWYFIREYELWLDYGCKLKVDGGHLYKARLKMEDNCYVEIDHGGGIMINHNDSDLTDGIYEFPLTCTLNIKNGTFR